jgi:protein-S-isoprenylcysteine O-methyltransferase Ste14
MRQDDHDCKEIERAAMKLNLITLAAVILFVSFFGMHVAHLPWTAWHIAGFAIAVPAFLLFVAARIELGRAFSVQAKATTLVTTGVYSRIRNPIYFFGAMFILGLLIWVGQPRLLLIFVVLIPLQIVRIRKEERVLTEKFGAAYLDYKRKTWF